MQGEANHLSTKQNSPRIGEEGKSTQRRYSSTFQHVAGPGSELSHSEIKQQLEFIKFQKKVMSNSKIK